MLHRMSQGWWSARHPHWTRTGVLAASVLAVLAIAVPVYLAARPSGRPSAAPSSVPATSAPIVTPSTTPTPTDDASASDRPSSAPPASTANAMTYLNTLTPDGAGPDTETVPKLAKIHDEFHSISTETGGCARSKDNSFAYPLAGQYARFRTNVALQSNQDPNIPSPQAIITITVDQRVVFDRLMKVGEIAPVDVPVAGGTELVLRQRYRGLFPDTCYTPATVFWADAALVS
jgi:hypothetical protein